MLARLPAVSASGGPVKTTVVSCPRTNGEKHIEKAANIKIRIPGRCRVFMAQTFFVLRRKLFGRPITIHRRAAGVGSALNRVQSLFLSVTDQLRAHS